MSILGKPVHDLLTEYQQRCHQAGERWEFPTPLACTRMQPEMQGKARQDIVSLRNPNCESVGGSD